jgi:hypothetical protein
MINYIKPECMPYYYDESNKQTYNTGVSQGIAYTTDGYLLPCCWCDAPSTRKSIEELGFYNETLKLSNNESVLHIISSEVWKNFIDIIMRHPTSAPRCCKEKCGTNNN